MFGRKSKGTPIDTSMVEKAEIEMRESVKPKYDHGTPRMTVWQKSLGGPWSGTIETFYASEGFSDEGGFWDSDSGVNPVTAPTKEEVMAFLEKEAQRLYDEVEAEKHVEATTEYIIMGAPPVEAGQKRIV